MMAFFAYMAIWYFTAPPLSADELRADLLAIGYPRNASPGSETEMNKSPFQIVLLQEYRTDPSPEADLSRFYRAAFENEGWTLINVSRGRTMLYEFCKNHVLAEIEIPNDMAVQSYDIALSGGELAAKCLRETNKK
jgi:hypothetical protein